MAVNSAPCGRSKRGIQAVDDLLGVVGWLWFVLPLLLEDARVVGLYGADAEPPGEFQRLSHSGWLLLHGRIFRIRSGASCGFHEHR